MTPLTRYDAFSLVYFTNTIAATDGDQFLMAIVPAFDQLSCRSLPEVLGAAHTCLTARAVTPRRSSPRLSPMCLCDTCRHGL